MNTLIPRLFFPLLLLLATPVWADLPDPRTFSVTLELGNVKQARAWLDEGLNPNFEGHAIGTGLMIGAWEGNIPMMELFMARGANIQQTNRHGETALMLAAWKGRTASVQWLLERGAQPNREQNQWTALHYATFSGHPETVEPLLAAGADVNARSTNGSTVLMMAAREGHEALAARLFAAGANPAIRNDWGDDAVTWAMRQGNYDIAKRFTTAENFAELSRQAAEQRRPAPPPQQKSLPAPDKVEELLRMARLAESEGRRDAALEAYRKALAELKAHEKAAKVGAGKTAGKPPAPVTGIVIRAKRSQPERQGVTLTRREVAAETDVDKLLEQARLAEAAGNRGEALRLFRQASAQLKSPPAP